MDTNEQSSDIMQIFHGVLLQNRFLILEKYCDGDSYGMIFLGLDTQSLQQVIIKVSTNLEMNYNEYLILSSLNHEETPKYFPKFFGGGNFMHFNPICRREESYSFIAIEKLGKTLKDYFQEFQSPFTLNTVCQIGIQMIEALERFHDKTGYIHNDIKLENILVGFGQDGLQQLKLIDFGVSRAFQEENGAHLLQQQNQRFGGNLVFCSQYSMEQKTLSRRDDIISLTYLLLYLHEGSLDFLLEDRNQYQNFTEMLYAKRKATPHSLCRIESQVFLDFVNQVFKLKFQERPDYGRLRQCLITCMLMQGDPLNFKFDWIPKEKNISTSITDQMNQSQHFLVQQKLLDLIVQIRNNDDHSQTIQVASALFDALIEKEQQGQFSVASSSYNNFEGGQLSLGNIVISVKEFIASFSKEQYSKSDLTPKSLDKMFGNLNIEETNELKPSKRALLQSPKWTNSQK